jgi:hypothetical protein
MGRPKKLALIALIFTVFTTAAVPAQAGWLEFFFPTLRKKEYDPMQTLQAPFAVDPKAETPDKPVDPNSVALPENNTPLDQPHRDNLEISGWLTTVLSETLTFDQTKYQELIKEDEKYFTADGNAQYVKFLQDNNVIKVLDSGRYDVRSFVQGSPLLLNEGAVNGSYRWLYEVNLMVSYMERGVKDYKKLEPVNQLIVLTVQVGRVAGQKTGSGILIERWDGKVQRVAKK